MESIGEEKYTITVEHYRTGKQTTVNGYDGTVLFQQYRPLDLEPNPRAQTFVDHFLKGLNTFYREPSERFNETHQVGGNTNLPNQTPVKSPEPTAQKASIEVIKTETQRLPRIILIVLGVQWLLSLLSLLNYFDIVSLPPFFQTTAPTFGVIVLAATPVLMQITWNYMRSMLQELDAIDANSTDLANH